MDYIRILFWLAIVIANAHASNAAEPVHNYPIQRVPTSAVHPDDVFWAPKIEVNRVSTIPYLFETNDKTQRLDNFKRAAGLLPPGKYVGRRFNDTDVYKLLEAAAFSLANHPDAALDKLVDEQISIIAKAQEPDGYLFAARNPKAPQLNAAGISPDRWSRLTGGY